MNIPLKIFPLSWLGLSYVESLKIGISFLAQPYLWCKCYDLPRTADSGPAAGRSVGSAAASALVVEEEEAAAVAWCLKGGRGRSARALT